jgi:hypothetical protein
MSLRRPLTVGAVVLALSALCAAALASGRPVKGAPRCTVFPPSNPWNERVDDLPVAADSNAIVRSIGLDRYVHPDFGSGTYEGRPIGIPYTTVSKRQAKVPVSFDYADESDRGPYPIPRNAPIEGGPSADGDRHVIVVDRDRCRLLRAVRRVPGLRRQALARRLRRDLESPLEPPAPAQLDLCGRGRPADPAWPGTLRRGPPRRDRPRPSLHRAAHAPRVRLSRAPLRLQPDRP